MFSGEKLRVTICGAGRTSHLAAILFTQNPAVEVTLYTSRSETVTSYKDNGAQLQAIMHDGNVIKAHTVRMTVSVDEACSDADIIIITTPSQVPTPYIKEIYDWCCEYMGGGIAPSPIPADWPTIRVE